jgi:hypothetical protein
MTAAPDLGLSCSAIQRTREFTRTNSFFIGSPPL